jgi:hypothetical protein
MGRNLALFWIIYEYLGKTAGFFGLTLGGSNTALSGSFGGGFLMVDSGTTVGVGADGLPMTAFVLIYVICINVGRRASRPHYVIWKTPTANG